jgi:hypothetical protein
MSRVVVNDHPFDEGEIAYLKSRNRHHQVALNAKLFGKGGEFEGQDHREPEPEPESTLELDNDIYEHVLGLDIPGLKAELKERNLRTVGKENALRSRLAESLQRERDDNVSTDS